MSEDTSGRSDIGDGSNDVTVGEPGLVRIGELSRRVGISDHTLRAWETRYGLLRPHRSSGGFRLYSADDERRVRRMSHLLGRGLSPAEAARVVLGERDEDTVLLRLPPPPENLPPPPENTTTLASAQAAQAGRHGGPHGGPQGGLLGGDAAARSPFHAARDSLTRALDRFNDAGAHGVFDEMLAQFSVEAVLREVVVPFLHTQGERWQNGDISLIQEHFASNVIRGRLAGLARGWASGAGPRAVLACPPGELHDLALMVFGIVLRGGGWRVVFLGADTPVGQIVPALIPTPQLVVIAATNRHRLEAVADDLREMSGVVPISLAGVGASARFADRVGATYLPDDPVGAAQRILAATR
jgi:DNA-binding transcriptional MerR regulator/methanogenic corrinoid protein MtbC1